MISLLKHYVIFIIWISVVCLLQEISSELSKQKISLQLQEYEKRFHNFDFYRLLPLRPGELKETGRGSERLLKPPNYTNYSRGRLKNAPNLISGENSKGYSTWGARRPFARRDTLLMKRAGNYPEAAKLLDLVHHPVARHSLLVNTTNNNNNNKVHRATRSDILNQSINSNEKNINISNIRNTISNYNALSNSDDTRLISFRVSLSGSNTGPDDGLSVDQFPLRRSSGSGGLLPPTGAATEFSRHRIIFPRLLHGRTKRDIGTTWETDGHAPHITLGLNLGEKDVLLDLQLNRNLLSRDYFERHLNNSYQTIRRPKQENVGMCHYQGFIKNNPRSWAAVSTCNGVRGVVYDGEDTHYLEPIPGLTISATDPHYILRHQDFIPQNFTCGYTGRPTHPVRELFHDETFKRLLRYKRNAPEGTIRGPFNANSLSRFVELVLVADKTEYEKHGSDVNKIYERFKEIANVVNALYQPLNIFIALVGVEVWQDEDPVEISTDGDKTLTNFLTYRKVRLIPEHPNDNAQLLTGKAFDSGVVGKALKGPICTYQYSGGVNMDHSESVGLVATTVAHEMGHNFGMEHDTEEDCKCPDKRCIMAPSSGTKSPSHWSSCSHEYLAISFERSMDYCLRNRPTTLFDSPVCGNGFVEAGEQCDCGLAEHCGNPCCNASICMLFANATCATGHCCDLQTCRPRPVGTECRAALQECDLPEYCSGDSEYCPDNFYKEDGYACLGGKAYCYKGMCRTHEHQCRLLWGPTGKNSDDKCYGLNKEGSIYGNCGYNWANSTYKKCENSDIKCGMMHCKHFNERLEFGMESVSKVFHRFIADETQGAIPCRVAQVDLGLDMVDPGLAPDGAKCGYNKMCVDQRCMHVSSLRIHTCDCNRRGVCNNLGHCHCEVGLGWPDCKYPGLGGSQDSGPASNPNATNKFVVGMFVFFLGIVPLTVIILCLVYYVKGNFKLWWLKKGRPATSRLSGIEGRRGTSMCVEVMTKSQSDGAPDGSNGIRSPTPPSSQGSKSNSPLLNGHANGATPNNAFHTQLFRKYEGFTCSPIKEKATTAAGPTLTPIGTNSSTGDGIQVLPVTSPTSGKASWKMKPNPLPQNVWPPPGEEKPQVDISGPSLQTSTNPAVRAITPSTLPGVSPSRSAQQRPKSVPDASSFIVGSVPSTSISEEVGREQGRPSAVARIASFLSKKERGENPTLNGPPARQYNTLPRKAAKINRESLLQLEISSPMQLQATELPSNLVPVRPAPEIPMPSNLKPSEVKASQERTSFSKVSWSPAVSNTVEDPQKNDLLRIGSVREPSVTPRPPIPKFGSMRAPRPKSLPPPRPSQPPPRPPLPVIPGTPESEYFYDDCITVQIAAPLAREEKSPSQEGIYATIDEDPPPEEETEVPADAKEKKKGLFSMLYMKAKKKRPTEREGSEPLYCNVGTFPQEGKGSSPTEQQRENSPVTPSPSSPEDGGLLSEIVTELATREPQYVNTLSRKDRKNSSSPEMTSADPPLGGRTSPKKSSESTTTTPFQSPLSPSVHKMKGSPSSPEGEEAKPSPYVPYSSLKPRGVFSFFKSSTTQEETPSETTSPTPSSPAGSSFESTEKNGAQNVSLLQKSLAGVKAESAALRSALTDNSSTKPDTSSSSDLPSSDSKGKTGSQQSKKELPGSSFVQNKAKAPGGSTSSTATPGGTGTVGAARPRPVFPPDKVLHPTSDKLKTVSVTSASKKATFAPDGKTPSTLRGKGVTGVAPGAPSKPRVISSTSKSLSHAKDNSAKASTPSGRPNVLRQASGDREGKEKDAKGAGGLPTRKPQTQAGVTKVEGRGKSASKEKETPVTHKDDSTAATPTETKPGTRRVGGRLVSPTVSGAASVSKSGVLAAAAKSGPQGTSHVASLQQKFEKETHGAKPTMKGRPYKKPTVGKAVPKHKE